MGAESLLAMIIATAAHTVWVEVAFTVTDDVVVVMVAFPASPLAAVFARVSELPLLVDRLTQLKDCGELPDRELAQARAESMCLR